MYLLVNQDQYQSLQAINSSHADRRIIPRKSNNGNLIVYSDLLTDCENPGDTWYDWKEWLLSLQPIDDMPAPKPPKPSSRPRKES